MSKTIKNGKGRKITRPRTKVSESDIRKRAYEIYLNRDTESGTPDDDWFEAEEELMPFPRFK